MPLKFSFDHEFNHLLRGSTFNAATKLLGKLFGFITSYYIANHYGSSTLGTIATITSAYTLISLICLLGNQTFILKIIPENIEKSGIFTAIKTFTKIRLTTLCAVVVILSAWYLVEKHSNTSLLNNLQSYIPLSMFMVGIFVFNRLNIQALRALGDYKIFSLYEFLVPASLATTTLVCVSLNIEPSDFIYNYFLPIIILSGVSFYFIQNAFETKRVTLGKTADTGATTTPLHSLLKTSLPMFGITLSTALIAHFDILMLNFYTTASQVGVYSIYVKLVSITAITTGSVNSILAPKISKLYARKDDNQLKTITKRATLLAFSTSAICTALLFIFHKPILSLLDTHFLDDVTALHILLAATLISSFFGSVGFFLNMTGNQNSFLLIMILAAFINISLNYIFIPIWGVTGAALATLISVVVWNALASVRIYTLFRYTLFLSIR